MIHRFGPLDALVGGPAARDEPFLANAQNRLASAAIDRLIRVRRRTLGSCYLHGPSGVGKSLLARRFLRELAAVAPAAPTLVTSAAALAAEYAEATQQNRIAAWVEPLRTAEVLVCEDMQAIGRRPETQRLLTTLIDETLARDGRVLLTADRMPGDIEGLAPRLRSRCRGGAVVSVGLPDAAARVDLLTHFAAQRQIAISPEAAALAAAPSATPRDLQALLIQMEAASRHAGCRLDAGFVRQFLDGAVSRPAPTLAEIARAVCRRFGLRMSALRSSTRRHESALARQCAMVLARRLTGESLLAIAAYFGRKNHTAVIQACRRTRTAVDDDADLRHHLAALCAEFGAPSELWEESTG